MPTLGEELKRRREERDISLADISEATRIGTRFLKAIESDNFSVLPGGIFTRSFIRAYAKQVGMDEDEALILYQQQTVASSPEAQASQQSQTEQRPRQPVFVEQPVRQTAEPRARRSEPVAFRQSPTRTSWPTIIIAGGIALFVVIIVLALVKQLNRASGESPQQAAQKNSPPAQASAPPLAQPAQPVSQPGQEQPAPPQPSQPPGVTQGEPLVAKLEATVDNCSIQYWIDDAAKPTSILVRKGESQDLPPAQSQIKLNIGNRPALKLKINNRDVTFPEGTPMWGAKVTISRDNLQTFIQ
ncbi:MAG TPA: helix-turn-helix domain-containing protein [Blastocatellia bacterium]|nr:helix-turn-helix domain-containing protein [Blastocatellia bacterium]